VPLDFRQTWLWQHVFVNPRLDASIEEQEYFRNQLLNMRERVGHLVAQIASDMPGMTVHDLSHLDSLWENASLVAEGAVTVTPPEGFVFGASVLLHDAAMTIAAYPNGLTDIQQTVQWKDAAAHWEQVQAEAEDDGDSSDQMIKAILPDVLRRLHAQQAAVLAEQAWISDAGEKQFLISDDELRYFYGPTIGQIAHSHWWSIQKVDQELSQDLGAFPLKTRNLVDRIKVACLLRIADALHLDQLRAPRFLRTLKKPQGVSALHWSFQERLARPHIESDSVVFTSARYFDRVDASAWWLAYDSLSLVDRELHDVDMLLRSRGREALKVRRVKGIGSPEALSKIVATNNWRPVDARILASDVPRVIENLGGSKLYGGDLLIPLRELIQNAADAVQARRRFQRRPPHWGNIDVSIAERPDGHWLVVEDNGIGMSEQVLAGPLLDFGTSFWRSPLAMEEFPGLAASGMQAIGKFGIGFFSIFMLGDWVRVTSRRCDRGEETARILEIKGGPAGRPILWPAGPGDAPLDGGTRVEVLLRDGPLQERGLLWHGGYRDKTYSLSRIVAAIAPSLEVKLASGFPGDATTVVEPFDWLEISDAALLSRLLPKRTSEINTASTDALMRTLVDAGGMIFGRAKISGDLEPWFNKTGWVTVSGLRANPLSNVDGILDGEAVTAARDFAVPSVPRDVLKAWASEQAALIVDARLEDEMKANAAEVILECGGDIGSLPIVQWADQWMSREEFHARVANESELLVNFAGAFSYDEDEDEMHPRDFKANFAVSDEVVMVPKFDGSIVKGKGYNWPNSLFEGRPQKNRLEVVVRDIIMSAWDGCSHEYEDGKTVGTVIDVDVVRNVSVFERTEPEPIDD
jgi:hypothetical protein